MKQLGGQRAGQRVDDFALLRSKGCKALGGASEFGFADGFGALLQGQDGGNSITGLDALVVLLDFPADDGFGGFSFTAAIGEIGGSDLLEIVDVVDETAFHFIHAWVDIPRDGDIDEKHGAVTATVEEVLSMGPAKYLLRSSCAGDDDVGGLPAHRELQTE
jgi:hypothetical protein